MWDLWFWVSGILLSFLLIISSRRILSRSGTFDLKFATNISKNSKLKDAISFFQISGGFFFFFFLLKFMFANRDRLNALEKDLTFDPRYEGVFC